MKKNLIPLLGIAFAVAIIATGVFYGLVVSTTGGDKPAVAAKKSIVVAARDLKPGAVLEPADVKLMPWAGDEIPAGSFSSISEAGGLTVVEAILANEPLARNRLAEAGSAAGAALGVPSGWRAVSIHVADSSGVVSLLQPGRRVDAQVVYEQPGVGVRLRTALQNLEVLSVNAQPEPSARGASLPVVTLLARPAEADLLALADAAARIRLLLRHPLDGDKKPRSSVAVANLMRHAPVPGQTTPAESRPSSEAEKSRAAGGADRNVALRVRMAGAGEPALSELSRKLAAPRRAGALQVSPFPAGTDLENAVHQLEQNRQFEVLSDSRLVVGHSGLGSVEAASQWENLGRSYGVRVRFGPSVESGPTMRLRVQPEIVAPRGEASATRRIETEIEIADGQSFLVTGLCESLEASSLIERLFPARRGIEARELVVLVTASLVEPVRAAASRAR